MLGVRRQGKTWTAIVRTGRVVASTIADHPLRGLSRVYFKRTIAAFILLSLTVAGLSVFFLVTHLTSLAQARAWVVHTRDVIEGTQTLFSAVQDVEAGERSYLISQDERDLGPYVEARAAIPPLERRLAGLVSDNPPQVARVRTLSARIDSRLRAADRVVATARQGDFAGARARLLGGEGVESLGGIRSDINAIQAVERDNLARRSSTANSQLQLTLAIGLAVALLALAGLTAGSLIIARANRRLLAAVRAVRTAQTALDASNALSRAIFDNSPDYLMVLTIEGADSFVLAEINPALAVALRVPADRVRGQRIDDLLPRDMAERFNDRYRAVRDAGRPVTSRDEVSRLTGGHRIWESVLAPVRNAEGRVDRIIGSIRDITDRVKAEERLRDAQRMESVGQLTGGVAHDFNNLLQVIRGNLELLERAVADDPRASQRVKNALHGAERAAQLTRQLLAFARRQPLAPQVINLSRLVRDMADLLRRTLGDGIEVETVVAGGLWNTVADPAQVESALLNLALNARDAMPEGGGRLTVEIANASLDEEYARRAGDVTPGQYVMLAVSDSGAGMDEATKARVFEPFFTTKAEGKGTGLGLSMVYGFVKQSNGHIQIYSEPGHGTTVRIYLPRSRDAESRPEATTEPAPAAAGSRVVLVVEDEPAVRAAAVATLEEMGFACLQAGEAESALRLVDSDAQIDLVFTDVVMPGPLKTRDFAARVRDLRPQLPILFTSGYTENAIVHHGRLDDGVSLISKPYAKDELGRRIAGMMVQGGTTARGPAPLAEEGGV